MPTRRAPEAMRFAHLGRRDVVTDFGGGAISLVDHDDLRHDPALGLVLGRLETSRRGCVPTGSDA